MTETPPGGGPTVLRMLLARQLQALREKAGMTYEQAAEAIYSSPWTIRRMERAEGGLKPLTVKSLLMAYGITDVREIDAFLSLARDASKPGWWHSYDDVLPSWFRTAVGLEESATLIRAYEPQVVPGLLQTEGYIRAITAASFPAATEDFTERTRGAAPRPPAPADPARPARVLGRDGRDRAAPPDRRAQGDARADRAPDRGRPAAQGHRPGHPVRRGLASRPVRDVLDLPLPRRPAAGHRLQREP